MNLTTQIARFLDANNMGVFDETGVTGNIFSQTSPASPNESISIYTNGGPPGDRTGQYKKVAVQILIRTIPGDPRNGEALADNIIDLLNGYSSKELIAGGNYIVDTEAVQSGPNNIGQDESGRYEYSQNFILEYKT